jgi:hypothetical protein
MLLLYAANIFAAFEISIFRARPAALVCGVSAIAPLIGPIIFLCLPTQIDPATEEVPAAEGPAVIQPFSVPGQPGAAPATAAAAAHGGDTSGLRLASEPGAPFSSGAAPGAAPVPPPQIFQRGAFTFNRRFFETRFPGFFGVIRRDAEKDMVLVVKSARGEYTATRISRIASNDMHLQVQKGAASEEVMIPFSEVQEIRLQHKDA